MFRNTQISTQGDPSFDLFFLAQSTKFVQFQQQLFLSVYLHEARKFVDYLKKGEYLFLWFIFDGKEDG